MIEHQPLAKPALRIPRAKPLLALALACFAAWSIYSWLGSGSNERKSPAVPVVLAAAVHKDVPVYLDGLGTVIASSTVTVRTQVDGQLLNYAFKEGQDVHKGDVLAHIDPRTYQAQVDQATATRAKDEALLENARRDLARYIKLGTNVSGQTLDTQRATVRQLEATVAADQAAVDNASALLSYTTITSPIDGRTGIQQVDPGNIVHTSDANGLVVITQLQPIDMIFSLPQQNLLSINEEIGRQGTLQVQAMGEGGKTVLDTGTLSLVDNQIDQTTGTIKLKATFPNEKRRLWPGGFVNVRLLLAIRKDSIVVPSTAVQRGPQGAFVFVLKEGGDTVEMRPVTVAMTADQDAVIEKGISEGEKVVTDGMAKLQDGSSVSAGDKKADKAAVTGGKPEDAPDKGKHLHKKE